MAEDAINEDIYIDVFLNKLWIVAMFDELPFDLSSSCCLLTLHDLCDSTLPLAS